MNSNKNRIAHRLLTPSDEFYHEGTRVAFVSWVGRYPDFMRNGSVYRKANLVTIDGESLTLDLNMAGSHPTV